MPPETVPPKFNENGFNCPNCGAFAHQEWSALLENIRPGFREIPHLFGSRCTRCEDWAIWFDEELVYPLASMAPEVHPELPEDIKADYLEAADIFARSPRGAAALLRLAVSKLVLQLTDNDNLDAGIGELVARGLPASVQQMLDVVRVVGNNALHPGEMDVTADDGARAMALFGLLNEITETMIASPRRLAALYGELPADALESIERRNRKAIGK